MDEAGDDWLEFTEEIPDKSLSIEQVSLLFQEQIFESDRNHRMSAIGLHRILWCEQIAEMIAYYQGERTLD
jgi:hypothetical protein